MNRKNRLGKPGWQGVVARDEEENWALDRGLVAAYCWNSRSSQEQGCMGHSLADVGTRLADRWGGSVVLAALLYNLPRWHCA
jgi:hypothetical protein